MILNTKYLFYLCCELIINYLDQAIFKQNEYLDVLN